MAKIYWAGVGEKICKMLWYGLLIACVWGMIRFGLGGFLAGGLSGVGSFLVALPFCVLAGLVGWRLFAPALADGITHLLLGGAGKLKAPPPLLSPCAGMIAAGRLEEARAALLELRQQYPNSPEVAELLFQLFERSGDRQGQIAVIETYFQTSDRQPGAANVMLLLAYADLIGKGAVPLLRSESGRSVYRAVEKRELQSRLRALAENENLSA